jgi:hypothetical protein
MAECGLATAFTVFWKRFAVVEEGCQRRGLEEWPG